MDVIHSGDEADLRVGHGDQQLISVYHSTRGISSILQVCTPGSPGSGGSIRYTTVSKLSCLVSRSYTPVHHDLSKTDELTGTQLECSPPNLAPYGQGYAGGNGNQGCAIQGAQPGSTTLDGTAYLDVALRFYQRHMWRNFGIIMALWIAFVVLLLINIENLPAAGSNKAVLLYKRGGGGKFIKSSKKDAEDANSREGTVVNEKVGRSEGEATSKEKKEKKEKKNGNAGGAEDQGDVHADDT
jgi:hypothetical protein